MIILTISAAVAIGALIAHQYRVIPGVVAHSLLLVSIWMILCAIFLAVR